MKKHRPPTATGRLHSKQEGCHLPSNHTGRHHGPPQAEHDKHEERVAAHALRVDAEEVLKVIQQRINMDYGGMGSVILHRASSIIERLLKQRIPGSVESETRDE